MTKSSSSNYGRSLRLAALVGFLCLSCSPAQAVPYGVNVLVNGNAEQGPFSSTGGVLPGPTPVPGWTISSAFTVVDYKPSGDPSGFPKVTDSVPPDGLKQFFAGGNAATSTATQQIDLTANATEINQGKVTYDLSGWLGGYLSEADNAALKVEFFNGATLLGGNSIGPVTPADRSNVTGLLFRIVNSAVPPTATGAVVTLTMTRASNTFNDGYADSLSLIFRGPMVVTTTADSGAGSLRAAISAGNTITFDPNVFAPAGAPYFISLLTELPGLNSNMNIVGPGANVLTIQRSAASGRFRIFTTDLLPNQIIISGSTITISGLTLRNGLLSSTGIGAGAGILNFANLTLNDCVITGNQTTDFSGGGIYSTGGALVLNRTVVSNNISGSDAGGIFSDGPLTLNSSTVSGNQATRSAGGISSVNNVATINKCTISGNSAGINGGGLMNQGSGSGATANMTLTNCTVSGNSAASHGGGIYDTSSSGAIGNLTLHNCTVTGNNATAPFGAGGGIYTDTVGGGVCAYDNSIFKRGTNGVNVEGGTAQFNSGGHNLTSDSAGGDGGTGPFGSFGGPGDIRNTDPLLGPLQDNGGPTLTHALLPGSPAIDKGNTNLTTDQRGFTRPVDNPAIPNASGGNGSDIGAFEVTPGLVANVSTRLPVGTGDNVLIEGFTVQGPAGSAKKIIVRAIGPFLATCCGVTDALANPTLEIHDPSNGNAIVAMNDDWKVTQVGNLITADQSAEIAASGFKPNNDLESAIIANLPPGSYTAVVRGVGNSVGTGVVDAYDLSAASSARLVNVATRGLIQPGDQLMIAGFITQNGPVKAVVLAIGPSLAAFGVTNALPDTTLQLIDGNGAIVVENDDWKVRTNGTSQQAELEATGFHPTNDLESGFVTTLPAGLYSALVRGKPESTGIGVVQVYFLQ